MIAPRSYVPEIHDVHPGVAREFDALLDALPEPARAKAVLMVTPLWEGRFALEAHPEFVERLASHPGAKVLHGYTHSLGPDWLNAWLSGTENHSEFVRLSHAEAARRLDLGVGAFRASLGLRPLWFCAPRWRQSGGTTRALIDAGFAGYMLGNRYVSIGRPPKPMPALNFDASGRRAVAACARAARSARIARLLLRGRPFRLALHPSDCSCPRTWAQLAGLVGALERGGWTPISLDEAVS